jgi:two-component system, NarL family, response regulator LiaR
MKSTRYSLVIADDHSIICKGLQALISTEKDMVVLACASNGHEAIEQCRQHKPRLALLDIIMPGLGGIDAARIIRRDSPDTEVMVLTSVETEQAIRDAIQAEVRSYLLKDTQPEELIRAIRATCDGETVLSPRVAATLTRVISRKDNLVKAHSALSIREMEVLKLIAHGFSNKELADKLQIGEKTVKTHVSNVLGKLGIADRTQAAIYAWKNGLVAGSTPVRPSA